MSKVIYSDFETSQIRYIAQIMKKFLDNISEKGEIKEEDIPKGVYETSLKFIGLALDAESGNPENPSESNYNYYVAAKTMDLSPEVTADPDKFHELLRSYKEILESLKTPQTFNTGELENINKIKVFFDQLFTWANNIEYGKSSAFE